MAIFPPVDALERTERHAAIDVAKSSGVAWYLENASFQSPADGRGGSVPTIGCHSVIESPECVQARDSPDDDHREYERAAGEEPCDDRARRRCACAGTPAGRPRAATSTAG